MKRPALRIAILATFAIASAAAADPRMGIQPAVAGGVTVSWFTGDLGKAAGAAQLGYELGTYLPFRVVNGLEFRPGLAFSTKGAEAHRELEIPVYDASMVITNYARFPIDWNLNLAYVEAPMLLRARLTGTETYGWRATLGVAPALRVGAYPKRLVTGVGTNLYPGEARRFEVSGLAGLAFDWAGASAVSSLEMRLESGLTDVFGRAHGPSGSNAAILLAGSLRRR